MNTISTTITRLESKSFLKDLIIGITASFILSLSAPFTFHLPFTVVPLTLQVHVLLILSALLGSRRATIMVISYLCQGAMGMPVFAGGAFGIANLIGPRGGYLLGYLVSANLVGRLQEMSNSKAISLFSNMAIGNLVIYGCGVLWLQQFIGVPKAFMLGLVPFVVGDFLKLVVFSIIAEKLSEKKSRFLS